MKRTMNTVVPKSEFLGRFLDMDSSLPADMLHRGPRRRSPGEDILYEYVRLFYPGAGLSPLAKAESSESALALHRRAIAALDRQDIETAQEVLLALNMNNPGDVLGLHVAHLLDAFVQNRYLLSERTALAISEWGPHQAHFEQVIAMLANGLLAAGEREKALVFARLAAEMAPELPATVLAEASLRRVQGNYSSAIEILESRRDCWAASEMEGRCAALLSWCHIAQGELDEGLFAVSHYLSRTPVVNPLCLPDVVSVLWILHLHNLPLGRLWRRLHVSATQASWASRRLEASPIRYLIALGLGEMGEPAANNRQPFSDRDVRAKALAGFIGDFGHFVAGDYQRALQGLMFSRTHLAREDYLLWDDTVNLTVLECARRAGEKDMVSLLSRGHLLFYPDSVPYLAYAG